MKTIVIESEQLRVSVLNFGARISNIKFLDKELALTYEKPEDFQSDEFYLGASVGPIANRIANAKLIIDQTPFELPANEGPNCLHSGEHGFSNQYWDIAEQSESKVIFELRYNLALIGMRGKLTTRTEYQIRNNTLLVNYTSHCDVDTYVNTTNHVYFNLSGNKEKIDDHCFKLYAQSVLDTNSSGIPTGVAHPINNCLDYSLASASNLLLANGVDHHFNVIDDNDQDLKLMVEATSKTSGISLSVKSSSPGYQFYTGAHLKRPFKRSSGFCVETQYAPDAINQSELFSPLLMANTPRTQSTEFCFTKERE